MVLNTTLDKTQDIWSFGCLVFELIMGRPLFCVPGFGPIEDEDDSHLLQFIDILGHIPDLLFNRWRRSSRYFTPEKVLFNRFIDCVPDDRDPLEPKLDPLEKLIDKELPEDVSSEESLALKALLRRILKYDPEKRPTAAEILQDPWFSL